MRPPRSLRPLALVLLTALAACDFEQVIDLDLPPHQPSLVVAAFPTPDSTFSARIGRTASVLGAGPRGTDLLVPNARVAVLREDGTFLDSLRYVPPAGPWESGVYRSRRGLAPAPGVRYRLVAEAAGLPAVRAETVVPVPVPVAVRVEPGPPGSPGTVRLAVSFVDPGGDRVYHLTVSEAFRQPDGRPARFPHLFASADPVLRHSFADLDEAVTFELDRPRDRPLFGEAVFRNGAFRGDARTFVLDVQAQFVQGGGAGSARVLTVTLATLSGDYARYQQTLALQQRVGENPFAEPVAVHRNVEGGHGVFAGYALDRAEVTLR